LNGSVRFRGRDAMKAGSDVPDGIALPLLVIGYGNTLRSDDGAGPRVAEAVEAWRVPDVRAIAVHQLTPELAEAVSQSATVLFVDASAEPVGGEMPIAEVVPAVPSHRGHASDPASLLALAEVVYGRRPTAYLLAIPVETFDFGEVLSLSAERGVEAATAAIRAMLREPAARGTL
jgi:hydrogenase maturation protease